LRWHLAKAFRWGFISMQRWRRSFKMLFNSAWDSWTTCTVWFSHNYCLAVLRAVIQPETGRTKGGNGGNCPGPSAARRPPWWHLFVLNKIFLWKIVVIQKRYCTRMPSGGSRSRTARFVSSKRVTYGRNALFFRWLLFLRYIINVWS